MYWCVMNSITYHINENFTLIIFSFEQNVAKKFKEKSLKPNARIKIT